MTPGSKPTNKPEYDRGCDETLKTLDASLAGGRELLLDQELWPSEKRVVEIVANVYRETGFGVDREELRHILGARSTRSIPGVRGAQKAGLIRYDESERLVPALPTKETTVCDYCAAADDLEDFVRRNGEKVKNCRDGVACIRRKMHNDGIKLLPHPKNPRGWNDSRRADA